MNLPAARVQPDYFCSDGACPVIVGHVIAYRDTAGHITGTYGETLSPYLTDRIRRTLAG
ncbi:hypothetical protein SAMN05216282_10789 [Cryobacterium psychrotolerans]|uniref:Uncharacterized protein n=1 Tax=Cryobacterium psychrotolerans TaxID=386301 RepID=A0A1G9CLC5_9MICO|nr:hypothetical protein SAMN05216282_10789 [Cryobacterium psychrotolerans]